jgi:hypothetical protein
MPSYRRQAKAEVNGTSRRHAIPAKVKATAPEDFSLKKQLNERNAFWDTATCPVT